MDLLDNYEAQHRIIGLEYHSIPYALRHATTYSANVSINPIIIARLSSIFETDTPWDLNGYYKRWLEVREAVRHMIQQIDSVNGMLNTYVLHYIFRTTEDLLERTERQREKIVQQALDVEGLVDTITARRIRAGIHTGVEDLRYGSSRQGSEFRRWVWSLQEVQDGIQIVEGMVAELLGRGVVRKTFWRDSAD